MNNQLVKINNADLSAKDNLVSKYNAVEAFISEVITDESNTIK